MPTNKNDSDWKRINQFRREQKNRIVAQKVSAPSLISANAKVLLLARKLRENNEEAGSSLDDGEKYSVY